MTGGKTGTRYAFVREHAGIILVLLLGFVMRSYLSTWSSYWYDEYLSIYYYGSYYDNVFSAIRALAENSVHPPLYQFILYNWMSLFGDSELATRSLSNLFVAGATLCLYALTYRVYGRRVALGAALIFSLMYIPMRYAAMARSYAQTLFLACLSSWLLFEYLTRIPRRCSWKALLLGRWFILLTLANTALLLTHYYNIFFLGAQGVFVLIYFLARQPRLRIITDIAKVAAVTAAPVLVLLLTWGSVMAGMFTRYESRGNYSTAFPSADPWTIFSKFVLAPNFTGALYGKLILPALAILLVALALRLAWALYRREGRHVSDRTYFTLYLLIWAFVPCVMAFLLFLVAHAERYNIRYFIFCSPPLSVLILLALEEGVRLMNRAVSRRTAMRPARHYVRYALIYAIVAALLIVAPGGRRAASTEKENYRGIAEMVIATVRSDPKRSYIIYEANYRRTLDYYLSRLSKGEVIVFDTVSPRAEESKEFSFEADADKIKEHDFLIVAFTHKRTRSFPNALKRLGELYDVYFKMVDRQGRGIIIYKTKP